MGAFLAAGERYFEGGGVFFREVLLAAVGRVMGEKCLHCRLMRDILRAAEAAS